MFNRFDIMESHYLIEYYYNVSGVTQERKSNARRSMSTGFQLSRMGFKPSSNLSYDSLSSNGKEIYETLELAYGFAEQGTFDAQNLKQALQYAVKVIAKHDNRPVLTCVYLDFSEQGYCSVVGCDGYRLHSTKVRYNGVWSQNNVLLPGKAAKTLASGIKKSGSQSIVMTYSHTLGKIIFKQFYKGKIHTWNMQVMDGRYPDYQAIIPAPREEFEQILTVNSLEHLKDIFGGFAFVQIRSDAGNKILFAQTNPNIEKYATTLQLPEECTLLRYESIGVNPVFLYDAILPNEKNAMTFRFKSEVEPIVVREGNVYTDGIEYLAVIMPSRGN